MMSTEREPQITDYCRWFLEREGWEGGWCSDSDSK